MTLGPVMLAILSHGPLPVQGRAGQASRSGAGQASRSLFKGFTRFSIEV